MFRRAFRFITRRRRKKEKEKEEREPPKEEKPEEEKQEEGSSASASSDEAKTSVEFLKQREPAKKIAEIEEELYTMAPPVKPVKGGSGEATAYQAPKEKEGKPSRKAKEKEDLDKKSKEARKGGPELPDSLRKVKKKQKPTAEQGVTALDPQTAMVQLVPSKEGAPKERRKKSRDRKPGAQLAEATQEEGSTRVVKPRKAWSKRFLKWRGSSEKQEEQEEAKPRADVVIPEMYRKKFKKQPPPATPPPPPPPPPAPEPELPPPEKQESSEELDYWLFPDGRPTKEFTLSVIPSALSGLLQTDEKAPGQPSLPEPPVPVPGSVPHVPETYGVADRPPPKPARQGSGPSPRGSKESPPVDVRKSPQKRSAEALPKPGGPAMMSPAVSQGVAPKPSAPQPYYFPGVPPPPPRPPPKPPVFPPGPTPQQPTYFPGPPPQPAGGYPPGPSPQQPLYAPGPPAKQPGYPPGPSAPQPPAPPPKPPSFPSTPQEDYFAVPPPKPPGPPPGGATKPSKYVPGPGPSAPSAAQDDSYFASPSPAKPPNYFTGGAPPPSSYPTEPQAGQGYGTKPPGAADQQRYPSPTQYQPTRAPQMTQYPPR